MLVGQRRKRARRVGGLDVRIEIEVDAQAAGGVVAVLLRDGVGALGALQCGLRAQNVDARPFARFVERLRLATLLVREVDVLPLDLEACVGVDDRQVIRSYAQYDGILSPELRFAGVLDAELRL